MNQNWKKSELKSNLNPVSLSPEELALFFAEFPNWSLDLKSDVRIKKITREFKFPNFLQAFGYVSKIALLSEKLDHHAEIYNSYGLVKITLFTHSSKDITDLDRLFAFHAESLL